nr:expressed protein [Hymenolepis microstoma]CUU97584.1 hypothetical transcript [Hymenolepis microstoma]
MKNTSTLLLLSLLAVLALIALCGSAVSAAPHKPDIKGAKKPHVEMSAKSKGAPSAPKGDHDKKPMAPMKPDGPEAKKAYEERLAKCKGSSKEERCEMLARFFVYHECMDAEESCAFDHGKNGCMEKTFECIENVIGTA